MASRGTASILVGDGGLELTEIEFDSPGRGEVQVKLSAVGICHTDYRLMTEPDEREFSHPALLGHEGAGVVEDVGPGVEHVRVGDRIAIACRVPCGGCDSCLRGDAGGCSDSTPRAPHVWRREDGAAITSTLGVGLFAQRMLVDARAVVPVVEDLRPEEVAILGCAVMTGFGAVVNTAEVFEGATVAIVGCGGVGLSAVQAARLKGAAKIIGVDVSSRKLEWANHFGATDVVDASREDPVQSALKLTNGHGVDFAFDAVGRSACAAQCLEMLAHRGTAVLVGLPGAAERLTVPLAGKAGFFSRANTLRVSHGGDSVPQKDLPQLMQHAVNGRIDLGPMVTHRLGLDEINRGFDLMLSGESVRSVVVFDQTFDEASSRKPVRVLNDRSTD